MPIALFGAAMGLIGLGLACRVAAGPLGWPRWLGESWVSIGLAVLAVLLVAYVLKWTRHTAAAIGELRDPAGSMFAGTLPIALTLAGGGLAPYAPGLGRWVWWAGAALLLAWQLVALARILRGGIELGQLHPGWFLTFIGGIVVPVGAASLGMAHSATVSFSISVAFTPFIFGFVLYRLVVGPPLPDAMKPVTFILLVPPSVIFLNYPVVSSRAAGFEIEMLFFIAWLLAFALAINARHVARWPFTPAWWAMTFPLSALAAASLRHLEAHPGLVASVLAVLALVVTNVVVGVVLVRSLLALVAGRYLVPSQTKPTGVQSPAQAAQ